MKYVFRSDVKGGDEKSTEIVACPGGFIVQDFAPWLRRR